MLVHVQPSFVLHRRPYRETSLLLELFTYDYGRISVIANGVRKNRSVNASLLQLFVPLVVSFYGKTELLNLTKVEADGEASLLICGRNKLACGFYLNELLLYLLPKNDPCSELFVAYKNTLALLQNSDISKCEQALRIFEKKLLIVSGYGLPFSSQLNYAFANDKHYAFNLDTGFILCNNSDKRRNVFVGRTINAVLNEYFADQYILQDAKRLLRFILDLVLEGRKIYSRQLFFGR